MEKTTRLTTEEFIKEAKEIHGDKYDYSKTIYKKVTEKVCIICPKHGEFWQKPNGHLSGNGCPKCKSSKMEEKFSKILISKGCNFEYQKKFSWLGRQSVDFYIKDKKNSDRVSRKSTL